jgi:hypothetical protein
MLGMARDRKDKRTIDMFTGKTQAQEKNKRPPSDKNMRGNIASNRS